MAAITDPAVRLVVLAELLRNPAGLSAEQTRQLRALSGEELVRLAAMPEPHLTVAMEGSISFGVMRAKAIKERDEAQRYFIANQAPSEMLVSLFRMSTAQIAEERKLLDVPPMRRPRLPQGHELKVREAMHAWLWHRTNSGTQAMTPSDWIDMHKAFPDWNLATLWAVSREYRTKEPVHPKRKYARRAAPVRKEDVAT